MGFWPVDPQGYNTGWGELRIHPLDMAKLGELWMNQGLWHGRRIVSRAPNGPEEPIVSPPHSFFVAASEGCHSHSLATLSSKSQRFTSLCAAITTKPPPFIPTMLAGRRAQ